MNPLTCCPPFIEDWLSAAMSRAKRRHRVSMGTRQYDRLPALAMDLVGRKADLWDKSAKNYCSINAELLWWRSLGETAVGSRKLDKT
jgi:hypothetical protein